MTALTQRRLAGKTLWKVYGERRESFGYIEAIALIFKNGFVPKGIAEGMLRAKVTQEDVELYRRSRGEPLE